MLGSVASYQPNPLLASYAATKAFIANYTDALIEELKDTNVTVTLLVPAGASDTKANRDENGDDPQDVAKRGYDALLKGQHPLYGSNQVKLMVRIGNIIQNQIIVKTTRAFLEQDK